MRYNFTQDGKGGVENGKCVKCASKRVTKTRSTCGARTQNTRGDAYPTTHNTVGHRYHLK